MSSRFNDFSNKGKPLVIQFTVKHEQEIDCGGGYIKLFPSDMNQEDMHGGSTYNIMFGESGWLLGLCLFHVLLSHINDVWNQIFTRVFVHSGPDICGPGTKKVHVIFNYKGKNHLINKDIRCKVRHYSSDCHCDHKPFCNNTVIVLQILKFSFKLSRMMSTATCTRWLSTQTTLMRSRLTIRKSSLAVLRMTGTSCPPKESRTLKPKSLRTGTTGRRFLTLMIRSQRSVHTVSWAAPFSPCGLFSSYVCMLVSFVGLGQAGDYPRPWR